MFWNVVGVQNGIFGGGYLKKLDKRENSKRVCVGMSKTAKRGEKRTREGSKDKNKREKVGILEK